MSFKEKNQGGEPVRTSFPASRLCLALLILLVGAAPAVKVAGEFAIPIVSASGAGSQLSGPGQKEHLLEHLLENIERRIVSRGLETPPDLRKAKELLILAQAANRDGESARAMASIDEAFVIATRLARTLGRQEPTTAELRGRYADLKETVDKFRGALLEAARDKELGISTLNLADLDSLLREAEEQAAENRYAHANKLLVSAYHLVVANIAAVRANDTVVQRLDLDSPQARFRYEQDRYRSYELLVNLVLREKDLDEATVHHVKSEGESAAKLHNEAPGYEQDGDLKRAVATEEAAVEHLINALGKAGVYVPK